MIMQYQKVYKAHIEFDTDRKHKKLEKTKKLVFQKENVELLEACIEQNNDHIQTMHGIQFHSYFNFFMN